MPPCHCHTLHKHDDDEPIFWVGDTSDPAASAFRWGDVPKSHEQLKEDCHNAFADLREIHRDIFRLSNKWFVSRGTWDALCRRVVDVQYLVLPITQALTVKNVKLKSKTKPKTKK